MQLSWAKFQTSGALHWNADTTPVTMVQTVMKHPTTKPSRWCVADGEVIRKSKTMDSLLDKSVAKWSRVIA